MSHEKGKIVNLLEKYLPGYKAYNDRNCVKDDDKLFRDKMYGLLMTTQTTIFRIIKQSQGSVELVAALDEFNRNISCLANKLKYSEGGYSAFMANNAIDILALKKIAEYDGMVGISIVDVCEQMTGQTSAVQFDVQYFRKANDDICSAIASFDKRHQFIREL